MRRLTYKTRIGIETRRRVPLILYSLIVWLAIFVAGCSELQRPRIEPFYSETVPPPKQELRWSNGKMAKSLDPARAAAAPESDVVRAIYEGLTDLDSKSLREVPGIAEKWESSPDLRTWIFHLRKDARWSNGERVTSSDIVRSWKRLVKLPDMAASSYLYQNIVGMQTKSTADAPPDGPSDFLNDSPLDFDLLLESPLADAGDLPLSQASAIPTPNPSPPSPGRTTTVTENFGVRAVDDLTLEVSLVRPDKEFPRLVSNPIFRPVYGNGAKFAGPRLDPSIVTNGAFRIVKIEGDGISLERSETYWNRKSIALERVRFVVANTAEAALDAYKRGDVDVVSNATLAPLGLKLLAPYEDFRRTAYGALNFYEFNLTKPPFNDRRVREALAISIDRTKLTDGDLEGTTQPANRFLPIGEVKGLGISFDAAKARQLMENAGYAEGAGFPAVRLVINRNNTQHRVARAVARMWKQNLNIETSIVVKEPAEIEGVRSSGDFDLVRRGVVLAANDEMVNLFSIFGTVDKPIDKPSTKDDETTVTTTEGSDDPAAVNSEPDMNAVRQSTLTEEDAILELWAIPLYFPTSSSLVKPYVLGFETNGLDAESLKEVSINNDWRSGKP